MITFGVRPMTFKYHGGNRQFTPGDLPKTTHIELGTARRSFAAFQVGIWTDAKCICTRTTNPVFDKSGPCQVVRTEVVLEGWEQDQVLTSLVGLVHDDDQVLKADILLSQEAIETEAYTTQYLWIEVPVPENTVPGTYQGKVKFYLHQQFEPETQAGEVTFALTVYNVDLPAPADYRFYLDLWQHNANIARKYETELWSDTHFALLEPYVASLAALGQKAITAIVSEIPWSGQASFRDREYTSDLFEYSAVKVSRQASGEYVYDYTALDRYIQLCMKYGINQEIEVFGLINIWMFPEAGLGAVSDFGDGIRIRYYDEATGMYAFMNKNDDIAAYIGALEAHFVERGWIEIVRVVADEPADLEVYQQRLNKLHRIAPRFKFKAAIAHLNMIEKQLDNMEDYVPVFPLVAIPQQQLAELRSWTSGRLCWYVCCWPQLPNTFVGSPLAESQLIGVLTEYMGLDGFLRWNYTVWPENPRERISFRAPSWKAGDTNFVYPGGTGPLLTLRYKNLLRGIQVYELMQQAKAHTDGAQLVASYFEQVLVERDLTQYHPSARKQAAELFVLDGAVYEKALQQLLAGMSV